MKCICCSRWDRLVAICMINALTQNIKSHLIFNCYVINPTIPKLRTWHMQINAIQNAASVLFMPFSIN